MSMLKLLLLLLLSSLKTVLLPDDMSPVPSVSFLILHPTDTNYVVTDSETEKNQRREIIKVGKSSVNVRTGYENTT